MSLLQPRRSETVFTATVIHFQPNLPGIDEPLPDPSDVGRRVAVAVDLSDENGFAVRWALKHYSRPKDLVFFLHVRSPNPVCGKDWGKILLNQKNSDEEISPESQRKFEEDLDEFMTTKISKLAKPFAEANVPFKIHILKDHDMKERICLEANQLEVDALVLGSRGFGVVKKFGQGLLGRFGDYCVRHCACPVTVIKLPALEECYHGGEARTSGTVKTIIAEETEFVTLPADQLEFHNPDEDVKGSNSLHYFHQSCGLLFSFSVIFLCYVLISWIVFWPGIG